MKTDSLEKQQSLKEFFKSWTTIRYSILAVLVLGVAIHFTASNFTGENPITLLPVFSVVMPVYFVIKNRVIMPLVAGSVAAVVLVGLIPQLTF